MKEEQKEEKAILLEKIIGAYLESPNYIGEELDMVDEFAYLYVNHQYNLNIDCYAFENYVIKSDTLNYVHDFLHSLNPKYEEAFEQAIKTGEITFIQSRKKKRVGNPSQYEVIASYHLKDSFDLIHNFFQYWIRKHINISKNSDYFVDTFSILAEFLFQDYLESLGCKNTEPYYPKMNRFIYTNIFTVHMIVELKLIDIYREEHSLHTKDPIKALEGSNISNKELLSKNCQIIIDDILMMNQISLPFHKRYLYGLVFACFIHQKILKKPKLIHSFCYLIDHPENIDVTKFMKALGISVEEKNGRIVLNKEGALELKQSYLEELEDSIVRVNIDYPKK